LEKEPLEKKGGPVGFASFRFFARASIFQEAAPREGDPQKKGFVSTFSTFCSSRHRTNNQTGNICQGKIIKNSDLEDFS
jgi:hypothetical protein